MKVSRERVLENKRTILMAAGRLFRERGFETVTVTDVMKAAGLTHGGFYGYFKSKDDLIAQAVVDALSAIQPTHDLSTMIEQYLSVRHKDDRAGGCPIAALASDIVRQPGHARAEMTAGLERLIEMLSRSAPATDDAQKRRIAIGAWAAMIGALILARMSENSDFSNEILNETRAWLNSTAPTGTGQRG
ncbi:transcriptional regulator [Methylosinus sp. R-45379]|uniref:TetR/AcrR family transcriptional regulator n=1 Tax=Methylosinus sp. R-45379 TaxID=980563 RepID=UPI0007C8CAA9|nr:TetR/AcrR family transcriptional regulator [Methylosinus sp. R-45379]OAI30592.1 transcriptional regulator [Methylosinus sp. R-45379]